MNPPDVVAAIEMSDDANEDRWADAFWRAECAAREAAEAAGADADELTVQRSHLGSVTVQAPDGRAFRAVIRTSRAMHRVDLPRVARPE